LNEFERIVKDTIDEHSLHPTIDYDAEIDLTDITGKFTRILKQFSPFGPGNMNPVFLTRDLKVKDGMARVVGNNHLKLTVTDTDEIISFEAIAFDFGHYCKTLLDGPFDLCYTIEENTFNGKTTLQFNIKDIKPHAVNGFDGN
jgi:single-stranded-DNA-specific exonuclease